MTKIVKTILETKITSKNLAGFGGLEVLDPRVQIGDLILQSIRRLHVGATATKVEAHRKTKILVERKRNIEGDLNL